MEDLPGFEGWVYRVWAANRIDFLRARMDDAGACADPASHAEHKESMAEAVRRLEDFLAQRR